MAAVPTMANDIRKLSFARVCDRLPAPRAPAGICLFGLPMLTMLCIQVAAASAPKGPKFTSSIARTGDPASSRDGQEAIAPTSTAAAVAVPAAIPASVVPTAPTPPADPSLTVQKTTGNEQPAEAKIVAGLKDLKLETQTPPNLVVSGTPPGMTERSNKASNSQTPSDDTSQRADSNSELGTKPPSLDGKSITSGTTFALDEKESLRPDDSASVKAAAEDDDAFSIRGSYIAGSRMGSDVAARIHRIQIGDMPPRTLATHHVLAGNKSQGVVTPQSGISDKQTAAEAKISLVSGAAAPDALAPSGFYSQNPDEKLLEAMQSPKDRIFLLRLEQQLIEFVQDSKYATELPPSTGCLLTKPHREPYMDLPPSNSFCRMLTHRLADYYHMTHSFEAAAGAVRIFRTPFCRIPPSLSSIAASTSNSSSPAPVVLPRKIMRRGEDGEFAIASATPSKPTSEVGSDSKEKAAPAKEKYTSPTPPPPIMATRINLCYTDSQEKSAKRHTIEPDSGYLEVLRRQITPTKVGPVQWLSVLSC